MIHSEPNRAREPVADRPKTLLYVDDHAVNLMLMRALLSHRPAWRLNMASDAEAAFMIAKSQPHDLLLLDLRLPDMHGTELLRRLRAMPGLAGVPAVAVTAEDVRDLSDAGFCEVWPKPLDLRHTLRRLDHFLGADGEEALRLSGSDMSGAVPPLGEVALRPSAGSSAALLAARLASVFRAPAKPLPVLTPALHAARGS